jgi:glycosyltransferase involved in cell wall biosynthesis
MKVSIVTPYFNDPDQVETCLRSVLRQTYPDFELIVVDDGSSAKLDRNRFDDPRIVWIETPLNRGPAYARNLAIEKTRGEVVIFLDSDSTVESDGWIDGHVRAHMDGRRKLVGGGIVGRGRGFVANADKYCHWATNIPAGPTRVVCDPADGFDSFRHIVTNNMSLPASAFGVLGRLDESLRTGEDVDFCARAVRSGYALELVPTLAVAHSDRDTLASFVACFRKVGFDRIPIYRKHRMRFWWLLPRGLLGWICFSAVVPFALTAQTIVAWIRHEPRSVFFGPIIFLGYWSMMLGILDYLRRPSAEDVRSP